MEDIPESWSNDTHSLSCSRQLRHSRRVPRSFPKIIQVASGNLKIVVTGHGKSLRLHIKPKWSVIED